MVPVGRIELHHREFGVVPYGDAFVAEAAIDLEHPLEAAHHQPLQVQLGRDAQEHLLVERVVVGDEGLGIGAAGDRVQHRRFHLQEAVLDHVVADRADGLASGHEAGARGLVGDQVHVALAVLLLLIRHAVELVRQRTQALRQQPNRRGLDRQLAGLGAKKRALAAEDVAQVPVLEGGQRVGADQVLRDVELDAAVRVAEGAVLQRGEAGLAHHPLEHHAPGDRHGDGLRLELLVGQLAPTVVQLGRMVARLEVIGKGHALAAQRGQFLAALGNQLVRVRARRGGVGAGFGGHGLGNKVKPGILGIRRWPTLRGRPAVRGVGDNLPAHVCRAHTPFMKTRRAPIVDRKLRFALVGCGRIAQNHIEALHRHAGEAELVAVCDTDPVALNAAVQATQAQGFDSLTALLAGSRPDCVALATPSGLHPQQVIEIAAAGVDVMTEKPMATRWSDGLAHGARLRRGGRAPVRGQAEPPQPHAAAAQAGHRPGPLRPHLHGQRQRLLVAAAGLLRQRRLARHLGVRRRRVHEPGQPLRRPARLADRPGGKCHGLHRHAGAQHRGRGHRRGCA